jgi:uncharacterized FlaG/YvyC family protein
MNVTATARTAGALPVPTSGNAPPPGGKSAPAERSVLSVDRALEHIRSFLHDSRREVAFQRDEATGCMVIKVIDPASGEIIRQMPLEAVLKLAAIIEAQGFHTLDELV